MTSPLPERVPAFATRPERDRPARVRPVVSVRSAADLVSAVPYLVGFAPARSAVALSLRGPRLRVGAVARADLPDEQLTAAQTDAWCSELVSFLQADGPREVVVVLYDTEPWSSASPPHERLVGRLERAFERAGAPVAEAMYVASDRFWSYSGCTSACCPPDGSPLEPSRSSTVAAAYVLDGRAPLDDREDLQRMVAGSDAELVEATSAAVEEVLDAEVPRWRSDPERGWRQWQEGSVELFARLAGRALEGAPPASPHEAGRLLAGLLDRTTRDLVAVRWTRWADALPEVRTDGLPGQEVLDDLSARCPHQVDDRLVAPGGSDQLTAMLTGLAARADQDLALAPLVLLAMHAWGGGEGALARVAVERALGIDPEYQMAVLLEQLLRSGIAPAWVAQDRSADEQAVPSGPPPHISKDEIL